MSTSDAYTVIVWRDDARIDVRHTNADASSATPIVVTFCAADSSCPLTLYLSLDQARSLLRGMGRALAAAHGESAVGSAYCPPCQDAVDALDAARAAS